VVPEKVRNIALVGHGSSGKTTLAEAMLFVGGATKRMGSVEAGTSTFDYEPEEIDRGISLALAVASIGTGPASTSSTHPEPPSSVVTPVLPSGRPTSLSSQSLQSTESRSRPRRCGGPLRRREYPGP
jgi:hypothetical protein